MQGIIACETLYDEIDRLAPEASVRYLPHDLHEFPVNVGDDRKIGAYVVDAIESLEAEGVDSIAIAIAGTSGLSGIHTEQVPVAVSLADECVSTFRYREYNAETNETKDSGVYYLTRGLIDRAVDGYKLALAYKEELDALESEFEAAATAHPDLSIDWQESALFERAVEQGGGMSPEAVDRFFGSVLGFYHTVELLDTGSLYDIHEWYAEAMAEYIGRVADASGLEHTDRPAGSNVVAVRTVTGDLGLLETLLCSETIADTCDSPSVACFEPGEPITGD